MQLNLEKLILAPSLSTTIRKFIHSRKCFAQVVNSETT